MKANRRSVCCECDALIHPGDEIAMTTDLDWAHEHCPTTADPLAVRPGEAVCDRCWMFHAGECP